MSEQADGHGGRPLEGRGGAARLAAALAISALVLVLIPLDGAAAWARFALAAGLVTAAAVSHPDGAALSAAALFAAIAAKDGVLVVPQASAGLFHVVLAGSVAAAAWRAWRRSAPTGRIPALALALGLVPLAGAWSLVASRAPEATVTGVARLVMLWAAALVVAYSLRTRRDVRVALTAGVAAALALTGVALVQWLWPGLGIGAVRATTATVATLSRPSGFYLDPNFLGAHLVIAVLLALGLAGDARRPWAWGVAAAAILGAVVLTFSRSAWVEVAVGLAVLAAFADRRVRTVLAGVVVAAAIAGVALVGPTAIADRAVSVLETDGEGSNATRLLMVRSSLAMIADRPLAGTGLEAFEIVYPSYRLPGADPNITHPHQVVLAFVAETGLGGAVAVLVLSLLGGRAVVASLRSRAPAGVAVAAAVLALAAGSFFQFFLYFEVAWLAVGLLAASVEAERVAGASALSAGSPAATA
mgnify:CR=1 FL=1